MAPSAMLQGFNRHGIRAPAPAPTSGVASIGLEASLGLNMGLVVLVWFKRLYELRGYSKKKKGKEQDHDHHHNNEIEYESEHELEDEDEYEIEEEDEFELENEKPTKASWMT
ncbi:hypothetical protein Tco_0769967 [Tanacetum coccineum]|uniref:Uncharacterized protein n=1 Tax=Tanacetum coccineum TaxID=301880 RepID=A0ABQ4ZDG7_9ASTR